MNDEDRLVTTPTDTTQRLARGAVGTGGMVFLVVAATAPLTALSSNLSISLGLGVGAGTVGFLVLVGALLAVFTVGYLVLTRYVTNAGAYAAFVGFGLGGRAGSAAAFVATLAYSLASVAMVAATGYFATLAVGPSVPVPWYVWSVAALCITGVLGIRGVDLAQRVTTALSVAQFVIIALLAIAVLVQRPMSWSVEVFVPTDLSAGPAALTLVFCLLCFGGYEATAVYGEEARAPRRSIRTATYVALALLLVVFVLATWSITAAHADVAAVAAADPGALVSMTADRYLGPWSGPILSAVVALSFLAAAVAFHNMGSRYLFALGRSGRLPAVVSRVHPVHHTPLAGSLTQSAFTAVVIVAFAAFGADPLTNLFPAVSGITSLSLVVLMIGCCTSVIVAGLRGRFSEGRWQTLVAPAAAALGLFAILVTIAANYATVTGSDHWVIAAMPLLPLAAAIYGVLRPGVDAAD